jgi:hypothetical protein
VIATKLAGRPLEPSTTLTTNLEGLSAAVIRESSARSRERLGVAGGDVLDYVRHDPSLTLVALTADQRARLDAAQ